MEKITKQIDELAKAMGKKAPSDDSKDKHALDYQSLRKLYDQQANQDVAKLQHDSKRERIKALHGSADLNPKWTFDSLIEDSEDVREAMSIAQSFIAAHSDPIWREQSAHMMIFYGDYGRGKSHMAGAIANKLIDDFEISVLYRQLSTLLEMRFFSYDYNAQDNIGEKFRETNKELLDVDLLILDEVCVNESTLKKNTQSWLGNLLRQRAAAHKNNILITNHSMAELESALGKYCFESMKEYETYMVRFFGPSRRNNITDPASHYESTAVSTSGYVPNQVK